MGYQVCRNLQTCLYLWIRSAGSDSGTHRPHVKNKNEARPVAICYGRHRNGNALPLNWWKWVLCTNSVPLGSVSEPIANHQTQEALYTSKILLTATHGMILVARDEVNRRCQPQQRSTHSMLRDAGGRRAATEAHITQACGCAPSAIRADILSRQRCRNGIVKAS